jgi:hypothetical protein
MIPECHHIKTSGGKCGSPAPLPRLVGQPCCHFDPRPLDSWLQKRIDQAETLKSRVLGDNPFVCESLRTDPASRTKPDA